MDAASSSVCLIAGYASDPTLTLADCRTAIATAEARVEAELEARYPRAKLGFL